MMNDQAPKLYGSKTGAAQDQIDPLMRTRCYGFKNEN